MSRLAILGVLGLSAAITALLVLAAVPSMHRNLRPRLDPDAVVARTSLRRVVAETVAIVLAVVSLILLRRRGLVAGGPDTPDATFDPLLAAAPALLGLAVGIVTLRLYPYLIRLLARLGSRRRDIVGFVGFKRILLQPPAARLPLLVVLLAVAVAVFASVLGRSVTEGQRASSWQQVGADYRITVSSGSPADALDVSGVTAVEASALGLQLNLTTLRSGSMTVPSRAEFLALETNDYSAVASDAPAFQDLPTALVEEQSPVGIGTDTNPIPAIVSRQWSDEQAPVPGGMFSAGLGRSRVTFVVADIRDRFPGIPPDRPFMITSFAKLVGASVEPMPRATVLFLRAPEKAQAEIKAAIESQTVGAEPASRYEVFNEIHDAAFVAGATRGFLLVFALATVLAMVAAIAGLALTSRSRRKHLAYLRTLGLSVRQSLGVTAIEQLPPVVLAAVVGSVLGAGSAKLAEPGIDLGAFTGPGPAAGLQIDIPAIVFVTAGLVGAIVLAVAVFGYLSRHEDLGGILRLGDE
jgi:putative ABC transport system permease protein